MSEEKVSVPRLKRVRYKDGRTFEVVRPERFDTHRQTKERLIELVDWHVKQGYQIAGYALVLWAPGFEGLAESHGFQNSPLPALQVPDFVRNALMAQKLEDWTVQRMTSDN